MTPTRGQITNREDALRYITAGAATFTIVSIETGTHFTYRVRASETSSDFFFVDVLTGPDNTRDYTFIGTVRSVNFKIRFIPSKKSPLSPETSSVQAITWLAERGLNKDSAFNKIEFWHLGRCSRCGRDLTDPESIALGLGPVCREKMG